MLSPFCLYRLIPLLLNMCLVTIIARWMFRATVDHVVVDIIQMTILDSELDMQSSVAVAYLLSIVIKKSVIGLI